MTPRLELGPLTPALAAAFDERLLDEQTWGEHQWFGFPATGYVSRQGQQPGWTGPDGGRLAILSIPERTLLGTVQWFPSAWYGPVAHTRGWQIGVIVLPEYRARGTGVAATQALVEYLFAHTVAHRIEALCTVENIPAVEGAQSAGFTREGVVRRAQWRAGAWHDVVLLSMLRDDPRPDRSPRPAGGQHE